MSFFEDASLVLIPSAYKDQKVYSVKPTDGTGDLTFSRASSATRVASNGLIEKVRENLVLYSEQFNDASWSVAVNASVTANATTAPNGTTTADKIVEDTATSQHIIGQTPTSINSVGHTISVYAKAAERSFLFLFEDSAGGRNAYFDLSNGTIGTLGGSATASITSVGNGWYRCSVTYTASGTLVRMRVAPATANGTNSYTGDGTSGIFVWGAMVEVSDFGATDYIATTTAAVSVGPVSGLPRLDYLGSTCPRLLLEPQRTNSFLYSEQLNNVYWATARVTISANSAISPDGSTNADVIFPDNTPNTSHELFNNISTSAVSGWSGFFKMQGHRWVGLFGSGDPLIFFDLQNGVVGNVGAGLTGKIENYGNGWYRCSYIKNSGTNSVWGFGFADSNGNPGIGGTPDITKGVALYGFQAENGAYATSYIPTLGASVTRVADAASKTGITSLIGQTEGTLFADFEFNGKYDVSGNIPILIYTGTSEAYIFINTSGNLFLDILNAGVLSASISVPIGAVGRKKIAFAYKANDFVGYMNGVQIGTDTSGTVGAMSDFNVGSYRTAGYSTTGGVNQALLFKTRLTNSQLAELTA
jgi:hypothetical protein